MPSSAGIFSHDAHLGNAPRRPLTSGLIRRERPVTKVQVNPGGLIIKVGTSTMLAPGIASQRLWRWMMRHGSRAGRLLVGRLRLEHR